MTYYHIFTSYEHLSWEPEIFFPVSQDFMQHKCIVIDVIFFPHLYLNKGVSGLEKCTLCLIVICYFHYICYAIA